MGKKSLFWIKKHWQIYKLGELGRYNAFIANDSGLHVDYLVH